MICDLSAETVSLPVAQFTATPKSGPAPLSVSFDGSGCYVPDRQNYYIIGYDWSFGDGSDPRHDNMPRHTYTAPGVYVVSLTAVQNDNDGSVSYQRGLPVFDTITVTSTTAAKALSSAAKPWAQDVVRQGNGLLVRTPGELIVTDLAGRMVVAVFVRNTPSLISMSGLSATAPIIAVLTNNEVNRHYRFYR